MVGLMPLADRIRLIEGFPEAKPDFRYSPHELSSKEGRKVRPV